MTIIETKRGFVIEAGRDCFIGPDHYVARRPEYATPFKTAGEAHAFIQSLRK